MIKRMLVVGSKGSSGKTTLCLAFAKLVQEVWAEAKVAIVDLDTQQWSSTQFAQSLELKLSEPEEANFIFCDGGAKVTKVAEQAELAGRIVLTCTPGPTEIPVNQHFANTELKPFADKTRILFTRVKYNSSMDRDIVNGGGNFSSLFDGFTKCANFVHEWQDYRTFAFSGQFTAKVREELMRIFLELQR